AAARDPRFRVLTFPHRGLVETLNDALARCRGRYVARMDADDLMHRDRLAAQLAALESDPTLAAVGCHVRLFPRGALGGGLRDYERWLNSLATAQQVRADALVESPVAHPTLFIRADVLRRLAYRDLGWPEDYDLVLRLLAAGHEVGVVPRRLVSWREHPRRLTHTADAYRIERFTTLKARFLADGFLAGEETYVLWGYGHTGRAIRRALLAHGKRPSHVVELHPGRLGQTIHGAPVVAPDALPALAPRRIVASVAGATARGQIRDALRAWGFRELRDFVCVA
ncbi:MAG: glycosyltransferase, partial [Thermodesulfobacteriota bacterium]